MTQPIFTKHHLKMNREIAELRNRPETAQTKHPHPSPTDELHVFNPDHNLFCEDCGLGELAGNHGIKARIWDNDLQGYKPVYESPKIAKMYAEQSPTPKPFPTIEWGDAKQAGPLGTAPETAQDVLRDLAVWLIAPSLDPETLAVFRDRINAVLGPDRRYVDHIDGNPHNNDPANLRFVEARENRGGGR
jgi:hypothetical protein